MIFFRSDSKRGKPADRLPYLLRRLGFLEAAAQTCAKAPVLAQRVEFVKGRAGLEEQRGIEALRLAVDACANVGDQIHVAVLCRQIVVAVSDPTTHTKTDEGLRPLVAKAEAEPVVLEEEIQQKRVSAVSAGQMRRAADHGQQGEPVAQGVLDTGPQEQVVCRIGLMQIADISHKTEAEAGDAAGLAGSRPCAAAVSDDLFQGQVAAGQGHGEDILRAVLGDGELIGRQRPAAAPDHVVDHPHRAVAALFGQHPDKGLAGHVVNPSDLGTGELLHQRLIQLRIACLIHAILNVSLRNLHHVAEIVH